MDKVQLALVGEVISTVALAGEISREFDDDADEATGEALSSTQVRRFLLAGAEER